MPKVDLRIRDLRTDEERLIVFEDVARARAWLQARPPFVEGLGIVSELDRDVSLALRDAMRPFDAEELRVRAKAEEARAAAAVERERAAAAKRLAENEAHRSAALTADPKRPMEIKWTYDGGMQLTDPADPRAISEEARQAVLAWIAERCEWVRDRGQIVGEATVIVWPSDVPAGQERVRSGRFFPVTAP